MNRLEHKIFAGLFFIIAFAIWGLYGNPQDYPIMVAVSLLMVIVGSEFPDYDFDFGVKHHRSPITHSPLVPLIFFGYYLVIPYFGGFVYLWVYEMLGWFAFGYATHLFLDLFPTKTGLIARIMSTFDPLHVPGDIRGVPEHMERGWLIISGIICAIIFIAGMMLGRGVI